jgi:CHAT domain-containing protein
VAFAVLHSHALRRLPGASLSKESKMNLDQAIAMVKAAGYRVTKPRPRRARNAAPAVNAVGKPYGANFDPNYRMRTPRTSIARLLAPMPKNTPWVATPLSR